jgi:Asp-tRNA(Asn)/Glu-tRNA(Gln) amidotransferase A subunit family amidase
VKPTYDRISRDGVIPLSPSFDHIGFFTPDIETAIQTARVLYNDWDEPIGELKKPRLGIPEGPYLRSASLENLAHFEMLSDLLVKAGYELQHVEIMPDYAEVRARHDLIMSAEAARFHKEWFEEYESLYSEKFSELVRRGWQVRDEKLQDAKGTGQHRRPGHEPALDTGGPTRP